MSEELEVRSEELPQMLRECGAAHCEDCKLREDFDCFCNLAFAAADEIERLNKHEEV